MALRRGRRPGQEPQQGVSNYTHVGGSGNKVVGGAAGRDLNQDVTFADSPEGAAKLETAQARLDELRTALAAHEEEVADIEQCNEAVDLIDEELNSGRSKLSRLNLLIAGLALAVGSATDLTSAVDALREAVTALFT